MDLKDERVIVGGDALDSKVKLPPMVNEEALAQGDSLHPREFDSQLVKTLDEVIAWCRKNSIWPVTMGLACCAIEMMGTAASRFATPPRSGRISHGVGAGTASVSSSALSLRARISVCRG